LKFAQICLKQALKYTIFFNIQLNHFDSGKQFQKGKNCQIWFLKRQNGNPAFEVFHSKLLQCSMFVNLCITLHKSCFDLQSLKTFYFHKKTALFLASFENFEVKKFESNLDFFTNILSYN